MSLQANDKLAELLEMSSQLSAEEFKELTVAMMLYWESMHQETDFISDILMSVISAMVKDAGGEVICCDVGDDDFDEFFDDDDW